jgi:NitT/TauT family transport system substrate-binding protein/putative hydroxymethylpyrimidine transport system substrate-binding protein
MKRAAALLAAATLLLAACGGGDGGGAEPGAPKGATLVLDFVPNAVHAGIYAALAEGYYADNGIDLTVRVPGASTDAPKLLEAGRTDFAIMDIHDLAIAREKGLDLVGVAPIVERPLASVIAADRSEIRTPEDLAGKTVGVTGLPSDDAVLDSVLQSAGLSPDAVNRVTIGFGAVPALAAGRIDAATAFWNAEGVTLRQKAVPIRVFRVDDFGAPRYPELILATSGSEPKTHPGLVSAMRSATRHGYRFAVAHPAAALTDLLAGSDGLDRTEQAAELHALEGANAFTGLPRNPTNLNAGLTTWEVEHGILKRSVNVLRGGP